MMNEEDDDIDDFSGELEDEPDVIELKPAPLENPEEDNAGLFTRRRRAPERRDAINLWLISYSDFMTILFIFFLAMYGYAVLQRQRMAASQGAPISSEAFVKLMNEFKGDVGSANVEVINDVNKVTVKMKDNILFGSGSAVLTSQAKTALAELSKSLNLVTGDVIVEGHTDNVPIAGGRYRSNWELSAARAFSVIQALTAGGVPAKRLAAWGFGENRPVAANENEAGRQQNRRIEVIIFKNGPKSI